MKYFKWFFSNNRHAFILFSLFFCSLFLSNTQTAHAATPPYFKMTAIQAQGAGSDEFYVGRCFKVDILLNTGGFNTNGADVEINYNNNTGEIVQNNCSTPATQIYSDGLFNTYPSNANSVSQTKILLSAYNSPGVSTNTSNGQFGHFYIHVLSDANPFPLQFEFTQGLTTDTNLAQTNGDGTDLLQSVENPSFQFITDTDQPTFSSQSPSVNATNVPINATISFIATDLQSGLNTQTFSASMKKQNGSFINQTVSTGSIQTTNTNRSSQATGSFQPNNQIKLNNGYFEYNTSYTVSASVTDQANHSGSSTWSFTTEGDTTPPYTTSRTPSANASGVSTTSSIQFQLNDFKNNDGSTPGLGIDIDTISTTITSASTGSHTYTCSSGSVTCNTQNGPQVIIVTIQPSTFAQNEQVTVQIHANDLAPQANSMPVVTYVFSTADTEPPFISAFSPTANSYGNAVTTPISFHVQDTGTGVAIETLQIYVNNQLYTPASTEMTITGDASDYAISIQPASPFTNNTPVSVRISVRDQASSLNYLDPNPTLFSFIVGLSDTQPNTCPPAPTCQTCPVCSSSNSSAILTPNCPETPVCLPTICPEKTTFIPIPLQTEYKTSVPSCPSESHPKPVSGSVTTEKPAIAPSLIVSLSKINALPIIDKKSTIQIKESQPTIELIGQITSSSPLLVPLSFTDIEHPNESPFAFSTTSNPDGSFSITMKNVFPPGVYRIGSYSGQIGLMEIKKTNSFNVASLVNNNTYNKSSLMVLYLLFAFLVLFSIIRELRMPEYVGYIHSAFTACIAIMGILYIHFAIVAPAKQHTPLSQTDNQYLAMKQIYQDISTQNAKPIQHYTGILHDGLSKKPIINAVVSVNDQQVTTNTNGIFELTNISSEDNALITFPNSTTVINLPLTHPSGETYFLDQNLASVINEIDTVYAQRQFKKIYAFGHDALKKNITSDMFVAMNNAEIFKRIQNATILESYFDVSDMTILPEWKSKQLHSTFHQVAKIDYVYSGLNKEGKEITIKEPWFFIQENHQWKFIQ